MKHLFRLFLLCLSLFFIFGCKDDDPTPNPNPAPPKEGEVLKKKNVIIELPSEISPESIEGLVVSNAYGEYKLNKTTSSSGKSSSINYGTQINYTVDGLILTNVLNPQGDLLMCSIDHPERDPSVKINAEKTAIAILMQHPALITSNKEEYNSAVAYMKKFSEFDEYKKQVYREMIKGIKGGYTPDYEQLTNYRLLLMAMYNKSKDNSFLTPSQVRVNRPIKRKNGEFEFTITNEHKRVLHMYPKKVKVASNGLTVISSEYLKENGLPAIDVLTPGKASYWKIVGNSLKGDDSSPFEVTSEPIKVDIGNYDKLFYEVYGIGKLNKPFNQFSDEEKLRLVFVGFHGAYNDFIKPVIDLTFGIGDVADASGTDNYSYDFRYGSRKAPLKELLMNLSIAFLKDEDQLLKLTDHIKEKDYLAIVQQFVTFSIDQILGNKQAPEVKRRYLNNIYNIVKNTAGVSKTSQEFRDNFKKIANQISHVKKANFAGKVIKVSELAVDVSGAIYAYYNTEAMHTIIMDKSEEPYVALKTPESNTIFRKKGTVNFSWDFYRAGLLGEIKYDLLLKASRIDGATKELKFTDITATNYAVDFTKQVAAEGFYNFTWKVIAKRGERTIESNEASIRFLPAEDVEVPDGVIIENGVLKKWPCDKIPANGHVSIPNSVTSIGFRAFYDCRNLKSINIPNSVTSIGYGAFSGCSSLTSVSIPNSVTSIGDFAFYGCRSLTSVNIPNSVTSIGESAFFGCRSLTSVNIPNLVTSIGEDVFSGCSSLTSVNIPNSVTSIGDWAFKGCSSLTSVSIPNSVTSIGGWAFEGCSSLTTLYCKATTPPVVHDVFIPKRGLGYTGKLIVPRGSKSKYETAEGWNRCNPIVEE